MVAEILRSLSESFLCPRLQTMTTSVGNEMPYRICSQKQFHLQGHQLLHRPGEAVEDHEQVWLTLSPNQVTTWIQLLMMMMTMVILHLCQHRAIHHLWWT